MAKTLRFLIVPKVAHPWCDEVHRGARSQAALLSRSTGTDIVIEYTPPASCDVAAQNAILENALANHPDGIAIDPVDATNHMSAIRHVQSLAIPVVLFDSPCPDGLITSIGNDFAQQGVIAAERLAKLLQYSGKVAVMQGFPTAPNHKERYEAQLKTLASYPQITVVDGGIDNDDIETARQQALAVLATHPDLRGYLCCDASGPLGIASAIQQSGKVGQVKVVSMDGIKPILDFIKQGVIDSSSATIPKLQGAMSILMLWQASLGGALPQKVDTGIDVITQENVDRFLEDVV